MHRFSVPWVRQALNSFPHLLQEHQFIINYQIITPAPSYSELPTYRRIAWWWFTELDQVTDNWPGNRQNRHAKTTYLIMTEKNAHDSSVPLFNSSVRKEWRFLFIEWVDSHDLWNEPTNDCRTAPVPMHLPVLLITNLLSPKFAVTAPVKVPRPQHALSAHKPHVTRGRVMRQRKRNSVTFKLYFALAEYSASNS